MLMKQKLKIIVALFLSLSLFSVASPLLTVLAQEEFSNYENSAQAVTNNIHTIINNIDALTSTDNLTPKERSQLQTIRIKCQNLLLNENIPE